MLHWQKILHYSNCGSSCENQQFPWILFSLFLVIWVKSKHLTQFKHAIGGTNAGVDPGFFVGGGANPPEGMATYAFAEFSEKLHEIEKIFRCRGQVIPLGSATTMWSAKGPWLPLGPNFFTYLLSATKLQQGNVFTPICDSVHNGGFLTQGAGGSLCRGMGVSVQGERCILNGSVRGRISSSR